MPPTAAGAPAANGAAIKALREAYGWKGATFARAVGISHVHLYNVERGRKRASVAVLRKIADTLGVPLHAITSEVA